jgi:hypothetical protein
LRIEISQSIPEIRRLTTPHAKQDEITTRLSSAIRTAHWRLAAEESKNPQSAIHYPQSIGARAENQCPCGLHGSIAFLARKIRHFILRADSGYDILPRVLALHKCHGICHFHSSGFDRRRLWSKSSINKQAGDRDERLW